MKIKSIRLTRYKRFTRLNVEDIPESAKLIVLVGPNGSGKTSLFDAMNAFYRKHGYNQPGDFLYCHKAEEGDDGYNQRKWIDEMDKDVAIEFHDFVPDRAYNLKGHFYIRSAYRNEPKLPDSVTLGKQDDPQGRPHLENLTENDVSVSENYRRLIGNAISEFYKKSNDGRTVADLRDELTGKVGRSMENVFGDLSLSSLGDISRMPGFFFSKGTAKDFGYQNLSAGEKAAFDLILDMVVNSVYFPDAVYCIDEPETHMHTELQGRVLREMYGLIPPSSQLWIATHSLGMMEEAQKIDEERPGTVAFLDFSGKDFDVEQTLRPARIGRAVTRKFLELTLGSYSDRIKPKTLVVCEGDPAGRGNRSFDETVYTRIFGETHPETTFVSVGACSVVESDNAVNAVIDRLFDTSTVIRVIDGDDCSETDVADYAKRNIRCLSKRHIEQYLLDDEVIRKLCDEKEQGGKADDCIRAKEEIMEKLPSRGKSKNDIKDAGGEIYNRLKLELGLTGCGKDRVSFLRDTMAPLITPDTAIYKILEEDIFGKTPGDAS